ncbi:MAG TPA: hypothetical protein DCS67_03820, partial [Clostridiales bacterium UBA8960]|nr:hypothetical protein [Clostridiales bacterium UBA8960]
MGGTFDPIHYGHLMLAEQIRTSFHLDKVIFIPVGKAPHKSLEDAANKLQRYEMTRIATKSNPYFTVSDIEIRREETTFTIDTILALRSELHENDELFFITGADAILMLDSWKRYEALVQLVTFVGATRPGIDESSLRLKIDTFKEKYNAKIELFFIPALAISSTDIRERVAEEKSIRYLLPEAVEHYIHEHFLYKTHHALFFDMLQYLKSNLSHKRFQHCLETAHVARQLAICHSADPLKAEFAGLCHDLAKEYKIKHMNALIETFEIFKDPSIVHTPNLAHGEVAAGILKRDFDIKDQEILDAIKWHTYGKQNMSMLCKIIYVADIIEKSRQFDGVEEIRSLAFRDITKAIL